MLAAEAQEKRPWRTRGDELAGDDDAPTLACIAGGDDESIIAAAKQLTHQVLARIVVAAGVNDVAAIWGQVRRIHFLDFWAGGRKRWRAHRPPNASHYSRLLLSCKTKREKTIEFAKFLQDIQPVPVGLSAKLRPIGRCFPGEEREQTGAPGWIASTFETCTSQPSALAKKLI